MCQYYITLNAPFKKGFAALAGPNPIMVARGIIIANSTIAGLLGRLHRQVSPFIGASHSLSAIVTSGLRARPAKWTIVSSTVKNSSGWKYWDLSNLLWSWNVCKKKTKLSKHQDPNISEPVGTTSQHMKSSLRLGIRIHQANEVWSFITRNCQIWEGWIDANHKY